MTNGPPWLTLPAGLPALDAATRARLLRLHEDLDAEVAALGVGCWVRGDCCDFERHGHVLYAGTLELALITGDGVGPPAERPALCPFWRAGRCTRHALRPLGCRTYFCDARHREALCEIHERRLRELRALAAEANLEWRYVPLVAALEALRRGGGEAPSAAPSPGGPPGEGSHE